MVTQVLPYFSLHHQKTNLQLSIDKTPLWKSHNLGVRLEHRDQEGSRYKGKRSAFPLNASTIPQASTGPHWEGPRPGPTAPPVEKESPRWTPRVPALQDASQKVHSGLTSWGSLGECAEFDHWGSGRDGEGGGAYSNQHPGRGGLRSSLQETPSRDTSQWSASLLSWASSPIWPGSLVVSSARFGYPANRPY